MNNLIYNKYDLLFVNGRFINHLNAYYFLPEEKHYLMRYFTKKTLIGFLVYYILFYDKEKYSAIQFRQIFVDHTGYDLARRTIQITIKKIRNIEYLYKVAKEENDYEFIDIIQTGKIKDRDKLTLLTDEVLKNDDRELPDDPYNLIVMMKNNQNYKRIKNQDNNASEI